MCAPHVPKMSMDFLRSDIVQDHTGGLCKSCEANFSSLSLASNNFFSSKSVASRETLV